MQWVFIKHMRLRHTSLRDVTFWGHERDHADRKQDHEHTVSLVWGVAWRQPDTLYMPHPVLPLARGMSPDVFHMHERDQHIVIYDTIQEHDEDHQETPDFFDHIHKRSSEILFEFRAPDLDRIRSKSMTSSFAI